MINGGGVVMRMLMFIVISATMLSCADKHADRESFDVDEALLACKSKLYMSVRNYKEDERLPRVITKGETTWTGSGIASWTSGFYAGMLWQMYAYTGEREWKENASFYTELLKPIPRLPWKTHDYGFMMCYSYGLGYEATQNTEYKELLLEAADSLATLYNPQVGMIESWPWMQRKKGWPHTTIIDNMMNLELLFWASENGGDKKLRTIAVAHATKTKKDFIRADYSTRHIVVYDSLSPTVLFTDAGQGYSLTSTWSRGQAWALYGFTRAYQHTHNIEFLKTAEGLADFYIKNVPDDFVPYWDFDAPNIPDEMKDASAAAIAASALVDLAFWVEEPALREKYFFAASEILKSLSSKKYSSLDNDAFLNHSVGSKPEGSEMDVSMIYTDYYYLEALLKYKNQRGVILSEPRNVSSAVGISH